MSKILEISSTASKGGRVPIKIALLKIHTDPTETNKNGIHWEHEYVKNAIESAKSMPLCAEFADDKKGIPLGHGLTGEIKNDDGIKEPVFENSETVGVIESASIEQIKDDAGNDIEALVGTGVLYNQRYPEFVKWVRQNYALSQVCTSIEIMGLKENENKIVYKEEKPTDDFRTPVEFVFSGSAILSVSPADDNAIVLEVAQKKCKKEEQTNMEFNMDEIKAVVRDTMSEINSANDDSEAKIQELNNTITELNAQIEEKDNTISELNASAEEMQKLLDKMQADQRTYWEEREILEKEIAKAKVAEKLAEIDSALGEFNEEEKEICKEDIDTLKKNINACEKKEELNEVTSEINSIKSKICMAIVEKQKKAEMDAKIAEQNSVKETVEVEDIFSEMCSEVISKDAEDVNIF